MKRYICVSFLVCGQALAALPIADPNQVCGYLEQENLPTRGWKVQDESYASCSSNYREIGNVGLGLANNLAYYATGQGNTVTETKIVLNLNQPQSPAAALQALLQASQALSVQMFGKRLPGEIAQAIQSRKGGVTEVFQGASISVVRDDWPSGKGYEIQVVFK